MRYYTVVNCFKCPKRRVKSVCVLCKMISIGTFYHAQRLMSRVTDNLLDFFIKNV